MSGRRIGIIVHEENTGACAYMDTKIEPGYKDAEDEKLQNIGLFILKAIPDIAKHCKENHRLPNIRIHLLSLTDDEFAEMWADEARDELKGIMQDASRPRS